MKVYALDGVPPEILAYGMAKYSRSDRSMLDVIPELSADKAQAFLDTYYYEYGHKSIADMAHVAFGIEDISLLAAMQVLDEPLWDGQERSTRYQTFDAGSFYRPSGMTVAQDNVYEDAIAHKVHQYAEVLNGTIDFLREHVQRPVEMEEAHYQRTIRARALDVARLMLPLATLTSLGQVVSARTLERQIARLRNHDLTEVYDVANELHRAATAPAARPLGQASNAAVLPTLVKHSDPTRFEEGWVERVAYELKPYLEELRNHPLSRRRWSVELAHPEAPEDEILATLLYRHAGGRSYRQCQAVVRELAPYTKTNAIMRVLDWRAGHDVLPREMQSGYSIKLDVLCDLGTYRDLHRHRRCVQIAQPITPELGVYEVGLYWNIGEQAFGLPLPTPVQHAFEDGLGGRNLSLLTEEAQTYLLPLAARCRVLFKLDVAELAYLAELRTKPAGHFLYRRVAWAMWDVVASTYPALAVLSRPTDPNHQTNLLER